MKNNILILLVAVTIIFTACTSGNEVKDIPDSFENAQSVIEYLEAQNSEYLKSDENSGDISESKRSDTAKNGQNPYAVIVTCSDSRVPAEHIFNAGIGELFVIRTAGNVIGDYELGSIEYGTEHLGAQLVVVLGHTACGAVDAALSGGAHGNIKKITDEIAVCLPEDCDPRQAEILNVKNSIDNILESEIMNELVETGKTKVVGAIYDINSGKVTFI